MTQKSKSQGLSRLTEKMKQAATKKRRRPPSKQQMKVAIAKDVIALLLLKANRLKVERGGGYISDIKISKDDLKKNKEVNVKIKDCQVCALGAMLVAELDRNDKLSCRDLLKIEHHFSDSQIEDVAAGKKSSLNQYVPVLPQTVDISYELAAKRLGKYFSVSELKEIENSFESGSDFDSYDAYDANNAYENDAPRLIAIMANIVRNKGNFRPSEEEDFRASLLSKYHKSLIGR